MHLTLQPSRMLGHILWLAHGLSLGVVGLLQFPWLGKVGWVGTILLSLWAAHLARRRQPLALVLEDEHNVRLEFAAPAPAQNAVLLGGNLVTPLLVLLHLRLERGRLYLPILYDALSDEHFRALRVQLRLQQICSI